MSEEVNQSPDNNQSAENASPSKKEMDIQRSLMEIDNERKEKDEQQRFGYFSVPYPSTIGDQAYSQKQEYHHKVVDRKVISSMPEKIRITRVSNKSRTLLPQTMTALSISPWWTAIKDSNPFMNKSKRSPMPNPLFTVTTIQTCIFSKSSVQMPLKQTVS